MAVTLSTIAKHVGLSRQTVAFVLGDRPHKFREETRNRVFAAAEELGYRRNAASVAMSRGRYNAVGLLQSTHPGLGLVHANFLAAILEEIRSTDLHLSLGQVDDATLTDETAMPELMNAWAVDGLIISYVADYPERLVEILHRYRLPAVWTNVKRDVDAVYADDYAGVREATESLLALGHQRIAFVRHYDAVHHSSRDRLAGYRDAMHSAGLQPRRLGSDLSHLRPEVAECHTRRFSETRHFLEADRPTAVILDDDQTAPIFIHICGLLGIEIGKDISLLNVSRDKAPILGQFLTSAVVPTGDLAHAAIPMLLQKIEEREVDLPSVAVPYKYIYPNVSCRPPAF
ncbi:MAG TPA: LacI family DNA-binding transcriptional regulator [Tepidisphaeraceae bacterium]|jgi:DNA-binding LacI/PurR family transcriptional regulator